MNGSEPTKSRWPSRCWRPSTLTTRTSRPIALLTQRGQTSGGGNNESGQFSGSVLHRQILRTAVCRDGVVSGKTPWAGNSIYTVERWKREGRQGSNLNAWREIEPRSEGRLLLR